MADRPALHETMADAERAAPPPRVPRRAFAAMLLGNVILALGPWLVRLADTGPIASGFWRLAIAFPVLAGIAIVSHRRAGGGPVPARLWIVAAIAGACFAADLASWHSGILRTRLANAALFANVTGFFFAGYGFIVTRRWPGRWQATALLLAAAGMGLLLGRSYELSPAYLAGDLLCLCAGIAYTGYLIAIDTMHGRLGVWPTLATATLSAAIVLLAAALLLEQRLVPHDWTPLIALAIGSQVIGQALILLSMAALPPVVVGLGLLVQPLVSATIGWIAYGERLTPGDLIGASAIAAALVLVRRQD